MSIDPSAALTQFLGNMPTFIAVILAWLHSNARIGDVNNRFGDLNAAQEEEATQAILSLADGSLNEREFSLSLRKNTQPEKGDEKRGVSVLFYLKVLTTLGGKGCCLRSEPFAPVKL